MSKDFYFRLASVLFLMLGGSLFVFSALILPSYLLSSEKKNLASAKLESEKNETVSLPDRNILAAADDLRNKLNLIENAEKNGFVFSQKVMNEIIFKKTPGIKITEIFYENNPETGKRINVSGQAPNRETLLLFRQALEDNTAFSKVDLPISNFVKGSNIQFYLNLIPSEK